MFSDLLINAVQFRHFEKTISWIWHLKLNHCKFEIIQRFKKLNEIKVLINETSKIVNCETCAINKMHKIMNRVFTVKVIKSFKILHFDIIINDTEFDEIKCIAHFTNEFTSYNWINFFINYKKVTLFFVFKSLINQCDRVDLTINATVFAIRLNQKTSIEKKLQTWISEQKIKWNWFAKNISSQNKKFERFDVLLTEKIKYIKLHAKFFEKLYFECYLIAIYLINRTSIKTLNWEFSLMIIQRLIKQIIKWKIFHLKIFECKTFSLLKNANKSFKNEKMKSKTFIDYLMNYNSINIFRVWNFEKWTVNDYKNVIFDEIQYYNTYENDDLLKESEKSNFIEFQTCDFKSSFNSINSDDENWLKTSIREKKRTSWKNFIKWKNEKSCWFDFIVAVFRCDSDFEKAQNFYAIENIWWYFIHDFWFIEKSIHWKWKKKSIFSFSLSNSKFSFIFHSIASSIELINSTDSINNKNVIQRRKKKFQKLILIS